MKIIKILFTLTAFLPSFFVSAQELYSEYQGTWRGEVLEVVSGEDRSILGTEKSEYIQTVKTRIISGPEEGKTIVIKDDHLGLEVGDKFYFNHDQDISGMDTYSVLSVDRRGALIFLFCIFAFVVVLFGGMQGVRSILSLLSSFLAIFYILVPGLLGGISPIFISALVAGSILFFAIFFTHGFNRESLVAFLGTMLAVVITSFFAIWSVGFASLSGFATDESIYLDFNTKGMLDMGGILLGAIIIGVLGVLDDIAVTQAAVVTELYQSNPSISRREVYKRALRVGREHVGALVNTLVLAYTGSSLPLILYFSLSTSSLGSIFNAEIIATEVVRAIVGSVGLILTVPIVTLLASVYLKDYKGKHSHVHMH